MRNREKLSKMAQIDIIFKMAENRLKWPIKNQLCVLHLLDPWNCLPNTNCPKKLHLDGITVSADFERQKKKCYKCISEWLNSDATPTSMKWR